MGQGGGIARARTEPADAEVLRWERGKTFPELPARLLHGSPCTTAMAPGGPSRAGGARALGPQPAQARCAGP
eukprot:2890623-Pyramimonas_sp.AAC.1